MIVDRLTERVLAIEESIEYEFKYELTEAGYLNLLKVLRKRGSIRSEQQLENFYFDTPKLNLHRDSFRTRVRIVDNKEAKLTVKHPIKDKKNKETRAKVRGELEVSIPISTARSLISGSIPLSEVNELPVEMLKEEFKLKHVESLTCLGRVLTFRTEAALQDDFRIEIDRSMIFSNTVYEAEIEVPSLLYEWIDEEAQKFFTANGIDFIPSKTSKANRFMKSVYDLSDEKSVLVRN